MKTKKKWIFAEFRSIGRSTSLKMMGIRLAMPLLGILLWLFSIHASNYVGAALFSSGFGRAAHKHYSGRPKATLSQELTLETLNKHHINETISFANSIYDSLDRLERTLSGSQTHLKRDSPAHGAYLSYAPDEKALERAKDAVIAVSTTLQILYQVCITKFKNPKDCMKTLSQFKFTGTSLQKSCKRLQRSCTTNDINNHYRSINGTCNNALNGIKGESYTAFGRIVRPDYNNGVNEIRSATNKKTLPSARLIVTNLDYHHTRVTHGTLSVMQWGQFIEHDLSRFAVSVMLHTNKTIVCCDDSGWPLKPRYVHPSCFPISVPDNDQFFKKLGVTCMNYVRSMPAMNDECKLGPSQQMNQATHFLDGSQLYGTTFERTSSLRSFTNGLLEYTMIDGREFLPKSDRPEEECPREEVCFKSGDVRVNYQPQLTAMHTLWLREHNRIARELAKINQQWDDEMLFQEARRIVIAEMQHITYSQWLESVLGKTRTKMINDNNHYSIRESPAISNSFATAGLRALKSLASPYIKMYNASRSNIRTLDLHDYFQKPKVITEPEVFDSIIRGLASQENEAFDPKYNDDLQNKFYKKGSYGLDALSLDIQRSRDHGLPSYAAFRTFCNIGKSDKFDDFREQMRKEEVDSLKKIYSNPKDVDLIVGALMEESCPIGSQIKNERKLLGPTFSCIYAEQFARTKRTDRYFYTNPHQPKPFTKDQLRELKRVTLARIYCDNGDNIKMMQKNVFEHFHELNNGLLSCDGPDIPKLNLQYWAEK